jgi:hypothetical protein
MSMTVAHQATCLLLLVTWQRETGTTYLPADSVRLLARALVMTTDDVGRHLTRLRQDTEFWRRLAQIDRKYAVALQRLAISPLLL